MDGSGVVEAHGLVDDYHEFYGRMLERLRGQFAKLLSRNGYVGSNPTSSFICIRYTGNGKQVTGLREENCLIP